MYKILVVDDERLLRQGLIHLTNWTEHGYIITGEAANGVEALQFIKTSRPDIVITDIVMPVMNGIDLIKKLRESGDNLPVIIVSSYSEFQYVREALQLGAVDYLLKQEIDPGSLLQVIEKARSQAEQNRNASNIPLPDEEYLEQFFLSLLTSDAMDKATFFANLAKHGFALHDEDLQLILFCPEQPPAWPDWKSNRLPATLKKVIMECFQPGLTPFIFFSNERVIILLLNTSIANDTQVDTACIQAVNQIRSAGNGSYVAVLSEAYSGIEQTRNIYLKNLPVAQFRFYDQSQRLFKSIGYHGKIDVPVTDYQQLAALLEKFDFDGLYNYTSDYINSSLIKRRYFDPYNIKKMLVEVFNYLLFYLGELGLEMTEVKDNRFQYIKAIENAQSLPELLQSFKNITDMAANIRHKTGLKKYSELVTGVMEYIKANYQAEISLATAASHLHVNKNYLCDLFKQQTGENISDYLIKIRLEKAKEILKTGHQSVSSVGEQVGYPNPSYFVQLFKKHLGMTPLEYRNLYQK
jgi:two-component system response regulator YesN